MKSFLRPILLSLLFILISCATTQGILEVLFPLPKSIKEASAVEVTEKSNYIWTIEDSGNKAEVYGMDAKGKLATTLVITDVKNTDWEDLTSDKDGNLYIGDFGNNDNDRRDLAIFKINQSDLNKKEAAVASTISFYYPEQIDFPPKKSARFFDVESFFIYNNYFYLFTKNRSSKFDGTTYMYKVPNQPGRHAAQRVGSFVTGGTFNSSAITSADCSPDGKTIALLSSSYIWLFSGYEGERFLEGKVNSIDLKSYSQKEGICFKNNTTLLITDERDKKSGGNLYQLDISKL